MKRKCLFWGLVIGIVVGFILEKMLNSCGQFTVEGGLECFYVVPSIWTTVIVGLLGAVIGFIIDRLLKKE